MIKVFLDASVIIAAMLSPRGGSAKVIQLGQLGDWVQITSQTVIDEVKSHTGKINKSLDEIDQFIKVSQVLVRKRITKLEVKPYWGLIDKDDAHLIAGCKLTESDCLVTLDKKHLLKEDIKNRFKPLNIVNPEVLLRILSIDHLY